MSSFSGYVSSVVHYLRNVVFFVFRENTLSTVDWICSSLSLIRGHILGRGIGLAMVLGIRDLRASGS